jgi:hypothetical protein
MAYNGWWLLAFEPQDLELQARRPSLEQKFLAMMAR